MTTQDKAITPEVDWDQSTDKLLEDLTGVVLLASPDNEASSVDSMSLDTKTEGDASSVTSDTSDDSDDHTPIPLIPSGGGSKLRELFGTPKPDIDPNTVSDAAISDSVSDGDGSDPLSDILSPRPHHDDDTNAFLLKDTNGAPADEVDDTEEWDIGITSPKDDERKPFSAFAAAPLGSLDDHDTFDDDDEDATPKGPGLKDRLSRITAPIWVKIKAIPTSMKVGILVVGALTVIVCLIVFTGGDGSEEPKNDSPIDVASSETPPDVTDTSVPADLVSQVKTASSRCADPQTSAPLAFSTDQSEAWVCGRANGMDGAILNITFKQIVWIKEIRLTPGFNYVRQPTGDDNWNRYRVVVRILWRLGGKQVLQEIVPSRGTEAVLTLTEPIATSEMSLTIQESAAPDKPSGVGVDMSEPEDATAIQGIHLIGVVQSGTGK